MKFITQSTMALCGAFTFLVTLLFNSSLVGLFVFGSGAGVSPLPIIVETVLAMAAMSMFFLSIEKILPNFARLAILVMAVALPALVLILLLVLHSSVNNADDTMQSLRGLTVIVLGVAAIAHFHCFTRDCPLDSQGMFLASGLSITAAVCISFFAFSLVSDLFYGMVFIALTMMVAGVSAVSASNQECESALEPTFVEDSGKEIDPVSLKPETEPAQRLRDLTVLVSPLMLSTVFCTLTLGQAWEERLFAEFDHRRVLFLVVMVACIAFTATIYHYWRKRMSIDAFLVGLAVPLLAPVLVVLFEDFIPSSWIVSLLMLSQMLFLLYAWTSVLLIGRVVATGDSITSGFVVVFLLMYAGFVSVPQEQDPPLVSRIITFAAVALLVYLLRYFYKQLGQRTAATPTSSVAMGRALQESCDKAARCYKLSPRESELLPMLVIGFSASVIGKRAFISDHTVKTHRYRIYQKMNVSSHEELVEKLELINDDSKTASKRAERKPL